VPPALTNSVLPENLAVMSTLPDSTERLPLSTVAPLPVPGEVCRLTEAGLAEDIGHRDSIGTLFENERFLGV
jgi:hypothetical protein